MAENVSVPITLFLAGDVMTGRGIDQVLPHPGDGRLWEEWVHSATGYVELAEARNGPIPRPVGFADIWGEALGALRRARPDARIVNLETSVTKSPHYLPKGINYKMNPANVPCLAAAGLDCCVLANNHVLDWGREGLIETLETLRHAGIACAGAGRDAAEAAAPALIEAAGKGRVAVFGFGLGSSGIPPDWAAGPDEPGVNRLPDLSARSLAQVAEQVAAVKRPGDVAVASIHWGGNWGYRVPAEMRRFAHGLVESAGVDVVHGHSSHHARAIEVHAGKLILYGCGDFLNDYEGIAGYEEYRTDLALMYLPAVDAASGRLASLTLVPFEIRNFRLNRARPADAAWLAETLSREGAALGTHLETAPDESLRLAWREEG